MPRLTLHEFLQNIVLVSNGGRLPGGVEALGNFVNLVAWVCEDFPRDMQTEAIALDGNLTFCMANTLFDHNNDTFKAAFHHQTDGLLPDKFLHPQLRKFRWDTIKTINSATVYEKCVRGIETQSLNPSLDDLFLVRATRVFEFLQFETRELRTVCGSGNSWTNITRIPFVPALYPNLNGTLRNSTIRNNVPPSRVIALSDGIDPKYVGICWSQKRFFVNAPSNSVLQSLPGQGCPTPQAVVSHLAFLAQKRHKISADEIPSFLSSAKACYKYLQESGEGFTIPEHKEVWYNADDDEWAPSKEIFENSWVSTRDLCLNLDYDSGPLRCVRETLQSFRGLLRVSGVRTIQRIGQPPSELLVQSDTPYPTTLISEFQRFRKSGLYIDLHILIDNRELGVHKVVLCAASEYFQTMFGSSMLMAEQIESRIDWRNSEMCLETVERILDYIYTGVLAEFPPDEPSRTVDILLELMRAADCYLLPKLKHAVEIMLWDEKYLRPETAKYILECARECGANDLRDLAEEFCNANADIIEREEFISMRNQ